MILDIYSWAYLLSVYLLCEYFMHFVPQHKCKKKKKNKSRLQNEKISGSVGRLP